MSEEKRSDGLLGASLGCLAGGTMGSQIGIEVLGGIDEALPMALIGLILGAAVERIIMGGEKGRGPR